MYEIPRSICYKKVLLTESEYKEYQLICKRYLNGENLFQDTFETDDSGRIIFIRSAYDKEMSFEILHFLQNLTINQWLRYSVSICEKKVEELDIKIRLLDNKIALLDSKIQP
jgi:hypothetical protein